MNLELFLGFCAASFGLALTPGPDNFYVLTIGLQQGFKRGLWATLGFVFGCLVHTLFLALGLAALIQTNETLLWAIKGFGAGYLLYLTYLTILAIKRKRKIAIEDRDEAAQGNMQLIFKTFSMNVLNPKVSLFFLAFFPGFLFHDELDVIVQFLILGLSFAFITLIVFGLIAFTAGRLKHYFENYQVQLLYLQAIVFVSIALLILIPSS